VITVQRFAFHTARVCLWLAALALGWFAADGVAERFVGTHGAAVPILVVAIPVIWALVAVSLVTTVELLYPPMCPRRRRVANPL
jgi:hypothetical protein